MAQSNWLLSASSSFSDTAAGIGLGPLGVMERYGTGGGSQVVRRDWERDACNQILAANQADAESCPNHGA